MSFCIHVPRFLRQNRIFLKINAFVERYDLFDFTFLVLLSAFPLFQIFEHSTLCLLPICVFLLGASLISRFEKETVELDFVDFLVLLFLFLQISTAFTGFGRMVDALTAALLTAIWFSARRFFERRGEKAFIFLSSLALFAVSVVGIMEYLFGMAELRWVDASRFGDIGGRVTSFFSNPNILAVYLLLYFPFTLWGIFLPQAKGGWRWFYTASAAFCVLCILLTWSRGAWLGLFLECLLFLLFHSKKSRIATLFLPLLVLLSIPVLPQNFRGRLFSIGDLGESSVRYRLLTWRGTLRMFCEHPFGIGVGERAWRLVYPHYAVSGTQRVMHAHNLFLQVVCEVGIVGLVLFLLIITIAILRGWREKKRAALVALAGTLVMGMFDHLWYYPGLLVPFWSILALCTPNVQKVAKKPPFVDILHEN